MTQGKPAFDRVAATMRRAFPDHVVVWHRRSGVQAITIGARTQIMALGGAALIIGWLGIATGNLAGVQSGASVAKSAELARMQEQLAAMTSSSAALKGEVADRAAAIEKRQAFLAALLAPKRDLAQLAALMPRAGDVATARDLLPGAHEGVLAPFRKLETEQLAFVDQATNAADARLRDTQSLVRRLGLDPDRLLAASTFDAGRGAMGIGGGVGGPYQPVSAPVDAEPRFKSLFVSWKKLTALESALAVIPSYMPVKAFSYSSGFGVRSDPFTGMTALHAGVDMSGRRGDPIYAAATGVIAVAGWAGAYGNCIEVAHGRGLSTRYGHLSAILVHPGQLVQQGDVIARMGSTGRSTGTHLHFEVRLDGRAVNPRPYLDASTYVLAAQHRAADPIGPGYGAGDSAL